MDLKLLDVEFPELELIPYILLIIIIFIIFLIISGIQLKKRKKRIFLFITIISIIIITSGIISILHLRQTHDYITKHKIIEYSLELNSISGEIETVYFPLTEFRELQEKIKIKTGYGIFRIINTIHGRALEINFTQDIKIYGKVETTKVVREYDLTMINQSIKWKRDEYWIYYSPHDKLNFNCSFYIGYKLDSLSTENVVFGEGYLNNGWNTYWMSHETAKS